MYGAGYPGDPNDFVAFSNVTLRVEGVVKNKTPEITVNDEITFEVTGDYCSTPGYGPWIDGLPAFTEGNRFFLFLDFPAQDPVTLLNNQAGYTIRSYNPCEEEFDCPYDVVYAADIDDSVALTLNEQALGDAIRLVEAEL